MTETRLASSAPPDSDTMMLTVWPSSGTLLNCSTHIQTSEAKSSCSVATRLVARCVAPIWVRSPNLMISVIRLMTTAMNSSAGWWKSARSISPRKNPKFRVQARIVKKAKTTFSRFTLDSATGRALWRMRASCRTGRGGGGRPSQGAAMAPRVCPQAGLLGAMASLPACYASCPGR
jgi:hypothetical protein